MRIINKETKKNIARIFRKRHILIIASVAAAFLFMLCSQSILSLLLNTQKNAARRLVETHTPFSVSMHRLRFSYLRGIVAEGCSLSLNARPETPIVSDATIKIRIAPLRFMRAFKPLALIGRVTLESPRAHIVTESNYWEHVRSKEQKESSFSIDDIRGLSIAVTNASVSVYSSSLAREEAQPAITIKNIGLNVDIKNDYRANARIGLIEDGAIAIRVTVNSNLNDFVGAFVAFDETQTFINYDIAGERTDAQASVAIYENMNIIGSYERDFKNNASAFSYQFDAIDQSLIKEIFLSVSRLFPDALKAIPQWNPERIVSDSFAEDAKGKFEIAGKSGTGNDDFLKAGLTIETKAARLDVRASFAENALSIDTARAFLYGGSATLSGKARLLPEGVLAPDMTLTMRRFPLGNETISGTVSVTTDKKSARTNMRYEISGNNIAYANSTNEHFKLNLIHDIAHKTVAFNQVARGNAFSIFAQIAYGEQYGERAIVRLERAPVSMINAALGMQILPGYATITGEYRYIKTPDDDDHAITIQTHEGYTQKRLHEIDATLKGDIITLNRLSLSPGSNGINISGALDMRKERDWRAAITVATPLGSYHITGAMPERRDVRAIRLRSTDKQISATGEIAAGRISLAAATEFIQIADDLEARGNIEIDTERAPNNAPIHGSVIARTKTRSPGITVQAEYSFLTNLSVDSLVYTRGHRRLEGSATLGGADNVTRATLALAMPSGRGSIHATADLYRNTINLRAEVYNIPIDTFATINSVQGDIQALVTVTGELSNPYVRVSKASILNLDLLTDRYNFTGSGSYRKGRIEIETGFLKKIGSKGRMINQEQTATIHSFVWADAEKKLDAQFKNLVISSVGINGRAVIEAHGTPENGLIALSTGKFTLNGKPVTPFNTEIAYAEKQIIVKRIGAHGFEGEIDLTRKTNNVTLSYTLDNTRYLALFGAYDHETSLVNATLSSKNLDASFGDYFFRFLSKTVGERASFDIDGERYTVYVRATGPLNDLSLNGKIRTRLKTEIPSLASYQFDQCYIDLTLEDKTIHFSDVYLMHRKSHTLRVEGFVTINNNWLDRISFRVFSTRDNAPIAADAKLGAISIHGPLALDLTFEDAFRAPRISGTLDLYGGDLGFNIDGRPRYGGRIYFNFIEKALWDLRITTHNRIHVDAIIADVYAMPGQTITVYGKNSDRSLGLRGELTTKQGTLMYLNRRYVVEDLTVSFPEIRSLDPLIVARAKTQKIKYSTGVEMRDVVLYLDMNARLSSIFSAESMSFNVSPPIRFYTSPPLEDDDVRALVGLPPVERSALGTSSAQQTLITTAGDILLQSYGVRPLMQRMRTLLPIDVFSVETGAFSEFSSRLSLGEGLRDTPFDYLKDTRFTVGKYLSGLYFTGEATYLGSHTNADPMSITNWDFSLGVEIDFNQFSDLANFVFEYKIDPFTISNLEWTMYVSTRRRF